MFPESCSDSLSDGEECVACSKGSDSTTFLLRKEVSEDNILSMECCFEKDLGTLYCEYINTHF